MPARRRRAWAAGARARGRAVEGRTGEGELGGLPVHLGEVLRLLGEAEDLPWHARRVGGVALAVGVPLARSVAERVERVVGWGSRRRRAPRHALGGVDERLSDLRHGRADFFRGRERRDPRAAAATEHSAHATRATKPRIATAADHLVDGGLEVPVVGRKEGAGELGVAVRDAHQLRHRLVLHLRQRLRHRMLGDGSGLPRRPSRARRRPPRGIVRATATTTTHRSTTTHNGKIRRKGGPMSRRRNPAG